MKVKDLIKELSNYDENLEVVIYDHAESYLDIYDSVISAKLIKANKLLTKLGDYTLHEENSVNQDFIEVIELRV